MSSGCLSRSDYEQVCMIRGSSDKQQQQQLSDEYLIDTNCSSRSEDSLAGSWISSLRYARDQGVGNLTLACHSDTWSPEVTQRIVTLAFIMTLTLFGNIIIIVVLTCSKYRKLNSRVNIFIINLAIGDLTVCCFTMTTEVLFEVFEGGWVLGAAACKILLYIQIVTLASTTFILTAMSFDRYMAICYPLSLGTNMTRAKRSIAIAWLMSLVCACPQLLIFKQVAIGIYPDGQILYRCRSVGYTAWWQRKLYITFMTVYILVIPTAIISYCYISVVGVVWRQGKDVSSNNGVALRKTVKDSRAFPKTKIKTIKMTLSIICSFIMCWTPYFVVHLIHIWSEYKYSIPQPVYVFAETIALLSSALNPILYGCFNIKLKRGLTEVFCPQRVRERAAYRTTTVKDCMNIGDDYHCVGAVKRLGNRCTEGASGSSSASHNNRDDEKRESSSEIVHGSHVDMVSLGDGKAGYKLRVRFGVGETDTGMGVMTSATQPKAMITEYTELV